MSQEYSRTQRIGDFLKRELAQLIQQEVRDPRIGMVNINAVEVSRDLAHAKVFMTFVGDRSAEERKAGMAALNKAAGYLRTLLAHGNQLRTTPRLFFCYDESVQRGADLSALIDRAVAADAGHHGHAAAPDADQGEQA